MAPQTARLPETLSKARNPDPNLSPQIPDTLRAKYSLMPGYWTRLELAEKLQVTTRTLDRWHTARTGPPRISVGNADGTRSRSIFYKIVEVERWLDGLQSKTCRTRSRRSA
jgi:hypothetical protein